MDLLQGVNDLYINENNASGFTCTSTSFNTVQYCYIFNWTGNYYEDVAIFQGLQSSGDQAFTMIVGVNYGTYSGLYTPVGSTVNNNNIEKGKKFYISNTSCCLPAYAVNQ